MATMTIDELLKELELFASTEKIYFDFVRFYPTELISWRGDYNELSLCYDDKNTEKSLTVNEFIMMLEAAIDKTFEGWKGGNFTMHRHTKVWVDNPGVCSYTSIVGIKLDSNNGHIVLITERE